MTKRSNSVHDRTHNWYNGSRPKWAFSPRIELVSLMMISIVFGQAPFTDITVQTGINFKHNGYVYGGGVAAGDFNNDGHIDLFIPDGIGYRNRLYLNNGNFSFSDQPLSASVADTASDGMGVVAGDIDNDGDLDLYVTNYRNENKLFLNDGSGFFTDATEQAGVGDPGPGTSTARFDYNNDGYLDNYVLNHSNVAVVSANILYRNNGDGTFTDVTEASNMGYSGSSLAVGSCDFNNDGAVDIIVVDEFNVDAFYRNNGDGTFTNVSDSLGIPLGEGMGIDFTDYDNDGDFDIYIANYYTDSFLQNNGDGTFTDVATAIGIVNYGIGWGVNVLDYDNDGYQDIYTVNGAMIYLEQDRPNRLYHNNGDGTFTDMAEEFGVNFKGDGRGSVRADFNSDGYVDIFFISVLRGQAVMYQNNGGENSWITLKLEGTQSNRDAVGARVEVITGTQRQIREVRAGSSYASTHPLDLNFGLAQASIIDSIVIYWPRGAIQRLSAVDINQILSISELSETLDLDTLEDEPIQHPNSITLLSNAPNPFNSKTVIHYQLPRGGKVSLRIMNILGQDIQLLELGYKEPGGHAQPWVGLDSRGSSVPSGIYFYRIAVDGYSRTSKMLLLK